MSQVQDVGPGVTIAKRYALKREIARGGMGAVFEAQHVHTGRTLALKLLLGEFAEHNEVRDRLLREARVLGAVLHPSVVEIYDAGFDDEGRPYVAMEMMHGRTLEGLLAARGTLSPQEAAQVGRQLCEALAYVHAGGVLHRDVKPANVYIANDATGKEVVKLFDFGVAGIQIHGAFKDLKRLTNPGTIVGTPEYMAPEQLFAQTIDVRADVYAAGVTLYECLTGDVTFPGDYNVMLQAFSEGRGAPSLREKRPDVPVPLAMAIERAAFPDPDKRFQDAMSFARALGEALGSPLQDTGLLGLNESPEPPAKIADTVAIDPDSSGPVLLLKRRTPAIALQRRRAPRAPYVTPAYVFIHGGATLESRVEEISETGVLLIAYSTLPIGERVRLRFAMPASGRVIIVDAVCRWSRLARGRYAMGLEFAATPLELRADVVAYASALSTRPL